MISRAQEPKQLYAEGGITSVRQPYFLGKVVKKIGKGLKKVVKSPIGKAALIGGGLWGLNKWGPLAGKISPMFSSAGKWAMGNKGKAALLGLGAAGMALPFMADEEEEIIETPWETTPDSIANIRDMARRQDSSLAFLPNNAYVQSGYYLADGGRAGLTNGGGVAEAQAENMLKMEYQKYRNQGGTMSYQQFKMQVLKQAQQQGPMAGGQPQMMNTGGRVGLLGGGPVPGSHVAGYTTPAGYNKYDYRTGGVRVAAANGGIMPLLDLGGKEKDYRQDGGFVGIGRREKADDVPARLSKNEFVFTADAVRNAGGGDVDAGAEVMENMMNHLEAGGQISEESQGLGGEEMISEEEMIEAPDGAQEMYEQQAMLQSRMA